MFFHQNALVSHYKETPTGYFPFDWDIRSLGEAVSVHDKKRIPLSTDQRQGMKGLYPYCGANGIIDYINDYIFDGEFILLAEDGGYWGPFDKSAYIMDGKFWVNNHAHVIQAIEGIADNYFLVYLLNFLDISKNISGTTRGKLNQGVMKNIQIPLPPLPEQRAIAQVLNTVRQSIEATERVITAARELKRSLMQYLFTYGPVPVDQADQVVLKETEIGLVPNGWDIVQLGAVAKIERGKFAHRPRNEQRFYGGSVPFIQTGDVARAGSHITTYTQTLNELGLSISRIFPRGTIVITIAANIGFTGILDFDSAFPDSLIGITPDSSILNTYLEYYLQTQRTEIDQKAPKGTQKNINIQFLDPWLVKRPPLDEQTQISQAIEIVEKKISTEEYRKFTLGAIFNCLLHNLLTGKVRVNLSNE